MTCATNVARRRDTFAPPAVTPSTPHPIYGTTPIGTDGYQLENMPLGVLNNGTKKL